MRVPVVIFILVSLLSEAIAQTTTPPPSCEEITWLMKNWWLIVIIVGGVSLVLGVVVTALIMRKSSGYQAVPTNPAQASNIRPVIPAIITAPSRGPIFVSQA